MFEIFNFDFPLDIHLQCLIKTWDKNRIIPVLKDFTSSDAQSKHQKAWLLFLVISSAGVVKLVLSPFW